MESDSPVSRDDNLSDASSSIVNYVLRNRQSLRERNYIRKAEPDNRYWVDFSVGPLQRYRGKWEDKFNVVIAGNETAEGDFFVLPYAIVKHLLVDESLTNDRLGRKRWSGSVVRNKLIITNTHAPMDIGDYYGRPFLLTHFDENDSESDKDESENDYAIENRKAEIKQRVRQSLFRRKVLANFQSQCCLTGITEPELLIASHIVPWANRVDSRLDPANGLCLSVLFDRLFDEGYITFDDNLRVITTPHLELLSDPLRAIVDDVAGRQAACPVSSPIRLEYLAYHREHVFRK